MRNSAMTRRPTHAGFTLVEILFAIAVVAILIGLLVAGLSIGRRTAAGFAGATTLASVATAASQFTNDFGIVPPLVWDKGLEQPWGAGERQFPVILGSDTKDGAPFLRHRSSTTKYDQGPPGGWGVLLEYWDLRYSLASLPYYLVGVDETPIISGLKTPIDGAPGVGIVRPNEDGTFQVPESAKKPNGKVHRAAETFGPFLDTARAGAKIARGGPKGERYELRDNKDVPIRYYRWLTGDPNSVPPFQVKKTADLNVPKVCRDPDTYPELRGAEYAIVWCGPDGLYGDEPLPTILDKLGLPSNTDEKIARDKAISDNVVQVGHR